MRVKIKEVKKMCVQTLGRYGFSAKDALIIVNEYLSGTLRGRKDHGLVSLPKIFKKVESKKINPKPKTKIVKEKPGCFLVDGDGGMGSIVLSQHLDKAVKQARKKGIFLIGFKNMHTWLRPGYASELLVAKSIISLVFNTGGTKAVVPTGGVEGVGGTNPVAFGIPGEKQNLVADFATSVKAFGVVRDALRDGKQLPKGYAIDLEGKECLDAQKTMDEKAFLLPMAGHKGYALNLLVEILTQSFLGILIKNVAEEDYKRGYMVILIDPTCFVSLKQFKTQTQYLFNKIKAAKKAPGVKEIFIPGERGDRLREQSLRRGYLEVEDELIKEIRNK